MRSQEFYNGEFGWLEKKMEIVVAMQPEIKTKTYENIFGIVLSWTQFLSSWYRFMSSKTTWNYIIIISLLIKDHTYFFAFFHWLLPSRCFSGEIWLKVYFIKSQKLKFSKTPLVMVERRGVRFFQAKLSCCTS